jgi:protein-disulfide isomerase
MTLSRRLLLALPAAFALPALPGTARAADLSEHAIGSADAKVVVSEWFSLTCPHCAHFALNLLPQIRAAQIDTGHVKLVFRDFPLDQVALTAAMVANSLPAERYEPFIEALFASQDRWAFARGINNTEEIAKMAALAGMPRSAFDAAIANDDLRKKILAGQDKAINVYKIDSTPSFIFNGPKASNRVEAGAQTPEAFAKIVSEVGG